MRRIILFFCCLIILVTACAKKLDNPVPEIALKIYVNHVGYEQDSSKKFVIDASQTCVLQDFTVINEKKETCFTGKLVMTGLVDGWKGRFFWTGDFGALTENGRFAIMVAIGGETRVSEYFEIAPKLLASQTLPLLLDYFVSQRSSAEYEAWDKSCPFVSGRTDKRDLHGGWYDASGDVSKYLSHLSYANYFNPQQAPMAVWGFIQSIDWLKKSESTLKDTMIGSLSAEAFHGADYLVRAQDPAGYFYINVFDKWSKDPKQREICAYVGADGKKTADYQAAYREGGGVTIAALARISTMEGKGEFESKTYLLAAERGFAHLEKNNLSYVDDGKENIIDDYCALLAATELFQATAKPEYLISSRKRARQLCARISQDEQYQGWWRADETGARPFFHAADAGLPVVALVRYLENEQDVAQRDLAISAISAAMEFQVKINQEVSNPFDYPRQYTKALDGPKTASFFVPHKNETGYWWQGENARLASLVVAAQVAKPFLKQELNATLKRFVINQFDWILGLNPFDICMVDGLGRNNPVYLDPAPINRNVKGGVCNGITAGFDDAHDIAFMPTPHDKDPAQNWRWPEQWVPHVTWMILATSAWESL